MISTPLKLRLAVVFAVVALASKNTFAKGPGVPVPVPTQGEIAIAGPGVPVPVPTQGEIALAGPGVPVPVPTQGSVAA